MAERKIEIKLFGILAEQAQANSIIINGVPDTHLLLQAVYTLFPDWENRRLLLAVNQQLVTRSISLNENDEIAIMPPFSGG